MILGARAEAGLDDNFFYADSLEDASVIPQRSIGAVLVVDL